MDQKYLIKNLKVGEKLAQLNWQEGYAIGCVEEDNYLWTWKMNPEGELVRSVDSSNEPQIWDTTAEDLETLDWCAVVPFDIKFIEKLGFTYDQTVDVYKRGTKYFRVEKQGNRYLGSFQYEGEFSWKEKQIFHFLHEFISLCKKHKIKVDIDIEKDCLMEFAKNNL